MLEQDELVKLVKERIKKTEENNESKFREIEHAPEGNCEKVSLLRGNPIHAAAKALLLAIKLSKSKTKYVLAILPGDRGVSFELAAKECGGSRASMAPTNKVEELLQCVVGRVPPFSFNQDVQVIVDRQLIADNQQIYFSPGRLDLSFEMKAADYENIIKQDKGKICNFSIALNIQQKDGMFKEEKTEQLPSTNANADVTLAAGVSQLRL